MSLACYKIILLALNLNVYFKGIQIIVNSCVPTVGSSLNARTSWKNIWNVCIRL